MSEEIERFIPVATMLVALVLGFIVDVVTGRLDSWKLALPFGIVAGFIVKRIVRSRLDAR